MRSGSLPVALSGRARISYGWLLYLPAALLLWFGSGRAVPPALAPLIPRVQALITIFLGIFIEALPFVLAGVLVSSAIALFVSDQLMDRLAPKAPLRAALVGAALG